MSQLPGRFLNGSTEFLQNAIQYNQRELGELQADVEMGRYSVEELKPSIDACTKAIDDVSKLLQERNS